MITTASKVAFIGWGVGSAWLNFTGISGHAMFAGAIFPVLMGAFASHAKPWLQRSAIAAGFGLAALVGLSRSMVDAHSVSEIVAGLLLGGLATRGRVSGPVYLFGSRPDTLLALSRANPPRSRCDAGVVGAGGLRYLIE